MKGRAEIGVLHEGLLGGPLSLTEGRVSGSEQARLVREADHQVVTFVRLAARVAGARDG